MDKPGNSDIHKSIKVTSHPLRIGEPGVLTQLPSSALEQCYIHVKAILDDIGRLSDIINSQADPYNKRLIGKFMIVELLSFQENARKLYNMINCCKTLSPVLKLKKSAFEDVFTRHPSFKILRNKLAAHRDDDLGLREAMTLWDSLTLVSLNEVLTACYDFFNAIHQSNARRFYFFNMDGVELNVVCNAQTRTEST